MSTLPRLMLIADGFASGQSNQSAARIQQNVLELVEAGLPFVQLRDHDASDDLFQTVAERLVSQIRNLRSHTEIVINSRVDVAAKFGCGLHLRAGESAPSQWEELQPCGYSAHELSEIQQAEMMGFDYATFSPIFPTKTHPDKERVGLESLRKICAEVPSLLVYALGGIKPECIEGCIESGAHGVAVLSDLLDSVDPPQRLEAYRDAGLL